MPNSSMIWTRELTHKNKIEWDWITKEGPTSKYPLLTLKLIAHTRTTKVSTEKARPGKIYYEKSNAFKTY